MQAKTAVYPVLMAALALVLLAQPVKPAGSTTEPQYEYAGVRFDGDLKTQVFLPGGATNRLYNLTEVKRPARVDERMFDLTLAMNVLASQGFEPIPAHSQTELDMFFRRVRRP